MLGMLHWKKWLENRMDKNGSKGKRSRKHCRMAEMLWKKDWRKYGVCGKEGN